MKFTIEEFKTKLLPELRASTKSVEELRKKAQALIDGSEIVDGEGNAVSIDLIEMTSAGGGEDEGEGEGGGEGETLSLTPQQVDDIAKTAAEKAIKALGKSNGNPKKNKAFHGAGDGEPAPEHDIKSIVIPARARRCKAKNIKGEDANRRAYRMGMWVLAINGNRKALQWCHEHGLPIYGVNDNDLNLSVKATPHKESINWSGGYWVPEEIDEDLIDLREEFGVFRQWARTMPMGSDVKSRRRRATGLTAYFVGEGSAGTHSTKTTDRITLTAKKLMVLTTWSVELDEDAVIAIGDDFAREVAYAFAEKEDDCGFNGDGTSTYGGIVGACAAIKNLSSTIANIAGLKVGTGNAYSELVLNDFVDVIGLLPSFGDTPSAAWYMHKTFYHNVCHKLILAAGGTTPSDWNGPAGMTFLGYPLRFSTKMPKTEANSQVCALLGDLSLAADFGDRRQTTIKFSEEATVDSVSVFETEELAMRGTERFDINVHDVGNASGTAASRVAGPIVGLITAAS